MRFSVPVARREGAVVADMRSYSVSVTERCSKVLQSFVHLPVC